MSIRSDVIVLPPPIGGKRRMRRMATATTGTTAKLFVAPSVAIVSSTDATPIVLTVAASNPYEVGDLITVTGHLVNTNANGNWTVSARTDTTVTLGGSTATGGGAGGASGTINYTDPLYAVPDTKCWVCFEALTNDCYIRIGGAGASGTTANNGLLIKAGATPGVSPPNTGPKFYLTPSIHTDIDAASTVGAGVLKWYICSPPCERERQ